MQVAQHLLGCSQSLQTVTQHVLRIYSENGQDENLTETAVRNIIIDLAARKSFAAKDCKSSVVAANISVHSIASCNLMSEVCHHANCCSSLLSKAGASKGPVEIRACKLVTFLVKRMDQQVKG